MLHLVYITLQDRASLRTTRRSELQSNCGLLPTILLNDFSQQEVSNDNTKSPMTNPTMWQRRAPDLMPIAWLEECTGSWDFLNMLLPLASPQLEGLDSLPEVNELVGLLDD